jgi:hypothetical protein
MQTHPDKQILIAIAVHIRCIYTGSAFKLEGGQDLVGFGEITSPIVEVQAVNQGSGTSGEFEAPAAYVQIQITISISVKKEGIHVLADFVRIEGWLSSTTEFTSNLLYKNGTRLIFGTPDEYIF